MDAVPGRTPDELLRRVENERASGRMYTLRDWLSEHPPPDAKFTQTLARVARRTSSGEAFDFAIREFLDEFALAPGGRRGRAIAERPRTTGHPRQDAYLGALAEHLAVTHGLERPRWCIESDRFLDRFWFPSPVPGFRALALAESPAAFRRRGIFIAASSLERC